MAGEKDAPERKPGETDEEWLVRRNAINFRAENGISRPEAALRMGISESTLTKLERGERRFQVDLLFKMADAYGHQVEHFRMADPPPADLPKGPLVFYKTMPGFKLDPDIEARIQRLLSEAERDQLERLRKLKKGKKP
jgi:transcriptional regulator with XRE-family HTH domain